MKTTNILITQSSSDYELVDSGDGEKLERFGSVLLARPDPQALWRKSLPTGEWKKAAGTFSRDENKGDWNMKTGTPERWQISFGHLKFWIKPSSFKHVGIFPEQSVNWDWLRETIAHIKKKTGNRPLKVLNLFAYTGGATLACAQAGAEVVHIDSSKTAMAWARENAGLSDLAAKPVRWILEDARLFVKRELKRGNKYDGIIMDPPAFGHGPDNEVWKIEEDFLPLVEQCLELLSEKPAFFLINGYSAGYSAIAYENTLSTLVKKFGGSIETGELTIQETSGRLLPAGIFARWTV